MAVLSIAGQTHTG